MRFTRLFLLFVLLALALLALSACDIEGILGNFGLGGTTTAPATTTAPPVTTAPPATTAPPVTTAPPTPANPIKKVTMRNETLQITYNDNAKQSLGTAEAREGYNGTSLVDYDLEKATGILTLILQDNLAKNLAPQMIGEDTPTAVTLRLRENAGNLEWAIESAEDWQVLCPSKVSGKSVMERLAEAAGIGEHRSAAANRGEGVAFVVSGTALRFRAREWKDGTDLCLDANTNTSRQEFFNFHSYYEVASSLPLGSTSTSGATVFKTAGDDITPIEMNGTYYGANHGYAIVAAVTNQGLTNDDIGSVWTANGIQFVLVRLVDGKAWFCPFDEDTMKSGDFTTFAYGQKATSSQLPSGTLLKHVKGAAHTSNFLVTGNDGTKKQQFFGTSNRSFQAVYLNGTDEIPLSASGAYEAEFVDFYEEYDMLYLPAVLNYLMDNAGNHTEEEPWRSEDIKDAYVTFHNTYRFHKNGACVIYSDYEFKKNVKIHYIGGVQSGALVDPEGTQYVYVPGTTNLAVPTPQVGKVQIDVGKSMLADPDRFTSSYFQLSDANGTKSINLGFNPLYGTAVQDEREKYVGGNNNQNLGFYFTSHKMYPRLIANTNVEAGTHITCVAYRLPSYVMDDDFTAINWYWVGEDIYLSLHTDKAIAKTVDVLPSYMNGMTATVIEGSDSFTVNSASVENSEISVTSTGAGYAIIKLSSAN